MNRTSDLFDIRIAEWLEDDPVQAPDQLLETVLAAVPSVPQRRAGIASAPAALPRSWQLAAAAAIVVVLGLLAMRALTPPTVAPSQSPIASPTQPAASATATPQPSTIPATPSAAAAGAPLPSELLGAWSHAAGAWWWFLPAGDPECVQAVHTTGDCAVWNRAVTTIEIGMVTYAPDVVSIKWRSGYCIGVTGTYTVKLDGDSLTLLEHPGGCEGGDIALTRAGTGSAPTAPPPPTP